MGCNEKAIALSASHGWAELGENAIALDWVGIGTQMCFSAGGSREVMWQGQAEQGQGTASQHSPVQVEGTSGSWLATLVPGV